jgi:hypothetical protein
VILVLKVGHRKNIYWLYHPLIQCHSVSSIILSVVNEWITVFYF